MLFFCFVAVRAVNRRRWGEAPDEPWWPSARTADARPTDIAEVLRVADPRSGRMRVSS